MPQMYFDIEVGYEDDSIAERVASGGRGPQPLPGACKIITFQYRFLDERGKGAGELQVFKEWESSEEEVIRKAHSLINPDTKWEIIPVGQNITFDLGFIRARAALYGIEYGEWFMYNELPKIDIKAILMGMNGFSFKNSGLDKFTGKESSGISVPLWYARKEYGKIMEYVSKEADEFIAFYSRLKELLPRFREQNRFF